MPDLVLLNGPPASGKSTLAAALVARRPLALALDVDLVRGQLGAWQDDPVAAGLAARRLALGMADAHLRAGHDVVVPQFVARPDFLEQLDGVALAAGARFVEVALVLDRAATIDAFVRRSAAPADRQQREAAEAVAFAGGEAALADMHDRLEEFLATRSGVRRVTVVRGDVAATLTALEATLAEP